MHFHSLQAANLDSWDVQLSLIEDLDDELSLTQLYMLVCRCIQTAVPIAFNVEEASRRWDIIVNVKWTLQAPTT